MRIRNRMIMEGAFKWPQCSPACPAHRRVCGQTRGDGEVKVVSVVPHGSNPFRTLHHSFLTVKPAHCPRPPCVRPFTAEFAGDVAPMESCTAKKAPPFSFAFLGLQLEVHAFLRHELSMRASLDEPAFSNHKNDVAALNRGEPMRDGKGGAAGPRCLQCL